MSFYVYSPSKEWLGEVRGIDSLQWLESYRGKESEAKLVCGATKANRELLKNDNLLYNTDRPHSLAFIVNVEVDDDSETAKLTARAKMTVNRLDNRVVMYTEDYTDAEQGILDIVYRNLRGLPISVMSVKGPELPLAGQVSWGSVLTAVDSIAASSKLGYRVSVDAELSEVFEVYRGVDRSSQNSKGYVGFFGDAAGNLASLKIKNDSSGIKNVAIVCGEGEGAMRRMVEVDLSGGRDRRELYVDARDISRTVTDGTTGKTLTDSEYDTLLYARGISKLAETAGELDVKAELRQSMLLFGQDYDLGDILPLRVREYNLSINVRVAKIKLIYEATKSIDATLEVV